LLSSKFCYSFENVFSANFYRINSLKAILSSLTKKGVTYYQFISFYTELVKYGKKQKVGFGDVGF